MGYCVAKKSRVTISDDEESDPLNIETDSSKSASNSSDEEEEDELNEVASKVLMTPPPTGVKKRKKKAAGEQFHCTVPFTLDVRVCRSNSRRQTDSIHAHNHQCRRRIEESHRKANLRLNSDEPWDTFKAQILVKISTAIKPKNINFDDYTLRFSITRLVPKPRMPIDLEGDYLFMIEQAVNTKTPMVSITINEDAKEDE
jgi:hypothetical protein